MAFAEQDKVFVNFTAGLNTEATPLNFPENAAQELDNFDLFVTGEVKRRLGIDFEESYRVRPETTSATNIETFAISNFEWNSVNGRADTNFLVVQIGLRLYFHNLGDEPVSENLRGTINLAPFITGTSAEARVLSAAYGQGIMVVANADIDPVLIRYDADDDSFAASRITIRIRDFEGIKEVEANDFRPFTLTPQHGYNLRNQGWPTLATVNNVARGSRGVSRNINPVNYTKTKLGVYPSNADIFYAGNAEAAEDAEVLGSFSPWTLENNYFGNTPAPKGHFIFEAFNQDRLNTAAFSKTTAKRPGSVAFYAGRLWFAGVPDSQYTGDIFFSQSLNDPEKAGNCYQEHDPTAEDLNALLATDGGVIQIADLGEVLHLEAIGSDLVIVSDNGAWAIAGAEQNGNFQADSFSVRKITDQGTIGSQTVISSEGAMLWWGKGGIWVMSGSEIDGSWKVDRLSRETIQSLYDNIPLVSKKFARVYYDTFAKKIFWLYNDTLGYDGQSFRFKYNRALVFDTTLGAFYTYTIEDLDENSPWISAMALKTPGSQIEITYNVTHLADNVVEGADNIVQDVTFESFAAIKTKLLTFVENLDGTYSYTFSEFKSRTFSDWTLWDKERNLVTNLGKPFTSVLQAGWDTYGDPLRNKTITHLTSFFNRTEDGFAGTDDAGVVQFTNPSGATVQVRWEFTDQNVNRWTTPLQAYRLRQSYIPEDALDPFDYGYTVVSSKLRMRGRGKGFSVRYESEEGKDLQLIGFAINARAGAKV